MKNKLKFAVAAVGMGLASMSNVTSAGFFFPDPLAQCVQDGMANYCRSTGQGSNCQVPTHVYYEIRHNCA